ncbi:TIGR00725 family protein [Carbonactinospora thermoautotrophica]|uniref:Dethiobiotin synthetase n=2 Tax=Carbonactinospora thermoautotrophica TaxID=1469144 RepID=A0A132MPY8_9ACTN|nr:TIGR00725 family protein [Carbonactinospora thermoautotrophica]KWW99795.1 hypothetical protein LI90_1434 [Carbonactinospora thermoautotrophica]KWX04465.1 dethiobiotin synthetase [Carbonactinospora thermoautotrophica]MCX9191214.1 TIGR00725 family protein [Carbonactinospora thermoautotrophica]
MTRYVAVVGPGDAGPDLVALAEEVGARLARAGAVVLTGGLGGVMAAASRGAAEAGGLTVGLLPGADRAEANPHVRVAVPTGLGQGRNVLLVRACDVLICVGGSWGTLSEVALARRLGRPVVALAGWTVLDPTGRPVEDGILRASTAAQAVDLALRAIDR